MRFEAGAQPERAPFSQFEKMSAETPSQTTLKWSNYDKKESETYSIYGIESM
jgi:hypothetical protein